MRFKMISAALAAALMMAGQGHAQARAGAALSLSAGVRSYDAGSALVVALRAEYPVTPTFLIEAAGSVGDPVTGARSVTSVFEVQAQGQIPGGRVVPYVGIGAGLARFNEFNPSPDQRIRTALISAGAGARIGIRHQLGVVADARFRGALGGGAGGHVDVTVGLRYRFR